MCAGDHRALIDAKMPDYEQALRRLAVNDDQFVAALLAQNDTEIAGLCHDPRLCALVRLGALIANEGTPASYQSAVNSALAGGATVEDVIGVLTAVAATVGSARVVAAAPRLARAVGFDVDEALDADEPASGRPRSSQARS
jgi:4-carboxymuconolactone decarboxylase